MASEKMKTHLQGVDSKEKFGDVKEIKEQETGTDSKLGQLALEIDITATKEKSGSKTDSFVKIDQLFSTLEKTTEDKKQLALQYALNVIGLEIGDGEQSKVVGMKDVIKFFNKAVTQKENGSWKLTMDLGKSGLTDDEKLIGAKFKDIIDNPTKHSALAYLIQRSAKEVINLEAAKGYGEESKRNEVASVTADMYLGNQTRQALSALESWIDSDLSENSENAGYLRDLTIDKIKNRGFIDASLKAKLESEEDNGIPSEVKTFWKENVGEGKEYIQRYPHSTNFAIMKADGTVEGGDDSEVTDVALIVNKLQLKDRKELTDQEKQELHTKYGIPETIDAIYKREGREGYYFFDDGKLSFIPELTPGRENSEGPVMWNYDAQSDKWEKTLLPESENAKAYILDTLKKGLSDFSIPTDGKDVVFEDGNWFVSSFGHKTGIRQTLTEGWVVKGNNYEALKRNLKCANFFNKIKELTITTGIIQSSSKFKIKSNDDLVLTGAKNYTGDYDLIKDASLRSYYPELVDNNGGTAFVDSLNGLVPSS